MSISRMGFLKIGWLFGEKKMFGTVFGGYINSENCKCTENPKVKIFVFLFTSWKSQSQITTSENLYP